MVQLRLRVVSGLQALQRCSGLLNRRARGSTVATHHYASVVKSIIILRFERRVCRWDCGSRQRTVLLGNQLAGLGKPILPDAPIYAALVQLPETLRSDRSGWGWKSLTRHHFAHVVQCRDGALKTRRVPVQTRPWAPSACSPRQRRSAQDGKVAGALQFATANSSIWGI